MDKLIELVKKLSAHDLKLEILRFYNDFSECGTVVLNVLLVALASKVTATEYAAFCNAVADMETVTL